MNKILLTFANAEEDLNLMDEITSLFDVVDLNQYAQIITKTQVNLDKIAATFRNHPDIAMFHFAGHAGREALVLEANGETEYAFMQGLTDYLGKQEHLQVVFLNGCETKAHAEALIRNGVSYVIATSVEIKNNVAVEFAKHFYSEIAKNQSVSIAYENAKSATATRFKNAEQTHKKRKGLKLKIEDKGFPWQLFKNENATEWHIKSPSKQLAAYYEEIKEYYQIHALNEKEAKLSDLYIIPDFKIHQRCYNANADFDKEGFQKVKTNIHDFVLDTFLQENTSDYDNCKAENARLVVLLGQPGQGKSSFCARVIHDFLKDNRYRFDKKLYFLRLKDLGTIKTQDFIQNPLKELISYFKEEKELVIDLKNALIILDGLDELSMREGLNNGDIERLIERLNDSMTSSKYKNLHCVLTSRFNYFNIKNIDGEETLLLQLNELNQSQQLEWLHKYQEKATTTLTEATILKINNSDNDNLKNIRELINQPILLHLIAKVDLDLDKNNNRAQIYNQLFDTLGKQAWNSPARKRYTATFEPKHLRAYISFLAYQIYISGQEHIQRKSIAHFKTTTDFQKKYIRANSNDNSDKALKNTLKEVLVSFYFKNKKEEKGTDALEFMHKSLREYLTAEYIWTTIKENFLDKNNDNYIKEKDWEAALENIWNLCHHQRITEEIHDYLIEIIQNDTTTYKKKLADKMSLFLEDLLRHQFIYEYKASYDTHSPIEKGITCFYVYWQVLAQLQMKTIDDKVENQNYITKEIKETFATILKLTGSYQYFSINLSQQNLEKLNLDNWIALKANLSSTNLFSAELNGANLGGVNLNNANLSGTSLNGANLCEARFDRGNLYFADLRQTYLINVNLSLADLRYVDFNGADLRGAFLNGADLRGIFFDGTILDKIKINNIKVSKKNWLKELSLLEYPPFGIKQLQKIYKVNPIQKKDEEGKIFYLIEEKKKPSSTQKTAAK